MRPPPPSVCNIVSIVKADISVYSCSDEPTPSQGKQSSGPTVKVNTVSVSGLASRSSSPRSEVNDDVARVPSSSLVNHTYTLLLHSISQNACESVCSACVVDTSHCLCTAHRLSWGVVLGEGGGAALGTGSSYASGVSRLASRSRMLLRRRGGGGRSLTSRWPLIPASDVPDSLINQV